MGSVLKWGYFTTFIEKIYFQNIQELPCLTAAEFFVPLFYFVRRHRHKPQPPPLCCQLLPGQQSTAKWCHWTLCRHPRLLRAGNSRRWGWTWTSARTCCRCTENPWRPRSQPGIAARQVEKEKQNWVINKVRCNKTNDKVKYAIK